MDIYIQEPTAPDFNYGRIYVREKTGNIRYNIAFNEEGKLEQKEIQFGSCEEVKPFLTLQHDLFFELIAFIAKELKPNQKHSYKENWMLLKSTWKI